MFTYENVRPIFNKWLDILRLRNNWDIKLELINDDGFKKTGDFKIDTNPIDGEIINLSRFAELGNEGVLCLLSDSTNAEQPGYTQSESKVGETFESLFSKAGNRRIIIATFASNIHRVQQIIDIASKTGRKVALSGRSLVRALACRNMDAHTRAAKQKCSFIIALGNLRTDAQSHAVKHQIGILWITVLFNAEIKNFPALLGQMLDHNLLERKTGKIRTNHQIFIFYCFHACISLYTYTLL